MGKRFAFLISGVALLAAWALTIDGNFLRQHARIDGERAKAAAGRSGSIWEDVTIRASDGVLLQAWLFTPRSGNHPEASHGN